MISLLLHTFVTFSWWIDTIFKSFLLFGEYPYPVEEDAE